MNRHYLYFRAPGIYCLFRMEMPAVVVLCSYRGLSFPSPPKIMSYCFSHIYFPPLGVKWSGFLSSLCWGQQAFESDRLWLDLESTRLVLWALSLQGAMGWTHPFTSSCLGPWKWGCGWGGLRVASFESEPRCCSWSNPESSLSLEPSDSTASYKQDQPEEILLAIEFNPLILWVRKLRLRER